MVRVRARTRTNYEKRHAGAEIPAAAQLGTHEEEWLKTLIGKKQRPKACTIKDCPCKT